MDALDEGLAAPRRVISVHFMIPPINVSDVWAADSIGHSPAYRGDTAVEAFHRVVNLPHLYADCRGDFAAVIASPKHRADDLRQGLIPDAFVQQNSYRFVLSFFRLFVEQRLLRCRFISRKPFGAGPGLVY